MLKKSKLCATTENKQLYKITEKKLINYVKTIKIQEGYCYVSTRESTKQNSNVKL